MTYATLDIMRHLNVAVQSFTPSDGKLANFKLEHYLKSMLMAFLFGK